MLDIVRLNFVQSIPGGSGKRLRIKSAEYPLAPFLSVSEAQNPIMNLIVVVSALKIIHSLILLMSSS